MTRLDVRHHCGNGIIPAVADKKPNINPTVGECKIPKKGVEEDEEVEACSLTDICFVYIYLTVLFIVGYANDFLRPQTIQQRKRDEYNPLYASFESFYTRHVYRRIRDSWNIPICGVPGHHCTIKDRVTHDNGWTFQFTGKKVECINMGSYNYLGFAENTGSCAEASSASVRKGGITTASTRAEFGNANYIVDLEKLVARFVGVDDALTCAMGFATNSLNLPCILDETCLVISDEKNHASIILGLRTSGATIRVFKHNDMKSLEKKLREGVVYGRPKSNVPWQKIFIVVEGVYSMEGTIVKLPEVLELKRKYKAYLYVDEAHSIGAIGPHGRGVCDYWGVDPREVDILMGTFTKSFGSAGGYIAGSKELIEFLRKRSHSQTYGGPMSAPVAEQIMSSMAIIMGENGTDEGVRRIRQLARNSRYFRQRLKQLRFVVYGNDDSPVIPVRVNMLSKLTYCIREMRKAGVAVVGVGYPATPILEGKIRFCMSASHTKEMLDHVLQAFATVGEDIFLRVSKNKTSVEEIVYSDVEALDKMR